MFTKLKISHTIKLNDIVYGKNLHNHYNNFTNKKISFFELNENIRKQIYSYVPVEFHDCIIDVMVQEANDMVPHIDQDFNTNVNFYFSTGSAKTVFYKPHDNVKTYQLPSQHGKGRSIDVNQVSEIARFIAEPRDIYILDVDSYHNVIEKNDEDRIVITLHSTKNYDEVVKLFSEYNLL
jgi:hypothetical protein